MGIAAHCAARRISHQIFQDVDVAFVGRCVHEDVLVLIHEYNIIKSKVGLFHNIAAPFVFRVI